jgi:hypothetical protein
MNQQRAKELLPVIQAFANGKPIQIWSDTVYTWVDVNDPSWTEGAKYRVKPLTLYVATWDTDIDEPHGWSGIIDEDLDWILKMHGHLPGFHCTTIEHVRATGATSEC